MKRLQTLAIVLLAFLNFACSSEDIPQAHKGQMFDRTGAFAFYSGGDGLSGPVLGSGTYFTGMYDTLRMVDCTDKTVADKLPSLTKNDVQFNVDVYVLFSANCEDESVKKLLTKLAPLPSKNPDVVNKTITTDQLWQVYIRPVLGKAMRDVIGQYMANDVNKNRNEVYKKSREQLYKDLNQEDSLVIIKEYNISNLGYPKELLAVNTDKAKEQALRDKAIAAKERIIAQKEAERLEIKENTENAIKRKELKQKEGEAEAARLDEIGAAYRRNPELAKIHMIDAAAKKGNLILFGDGRASIMVNK